MSSDYFGRNTCNSDTTGIADAGAVLNQPVVPTILTDLTARATTPAHADMDNAIRNWVQTLARKFRPSHTARCHLLHLQTEAFETEAAALAELLMDLLG